MRASTWTENEIDVRDLPKPDRHPTIFASFRQLQVGEHLVLINDHDPRHLREEFETEFPGSYDWHYLNRAAGNWQIKISKLTATPLPRVMVNTRSDAPRSDESGVTWKLSMAERDLDSNIITLPPEGTIERHAGPDLDVMIHVLAGDGTLTTEAGPIDLSLGDLVWLPRRSVRSFSAGADGLRYLTIHQRRKALQLDTSALRRA